MMKSVEQGTDPAEADSKESIETVENQKQMGSECWSCGKDLDRKGLYCIACAIKRGTINRTYIRKRTRFFRRGVRENFKGD